jgi:hypothetical protein
MKRRPSRPDASKPILSLTPYWKAFNLEEKAGVRCLELVFPN